MLDAFVKATVALVASVVVGTPLNQTEPPLPRKPALGAALAADPQGVKINQVVPGQTAEGHLLPGDIVKSLAGTPTPNVPEFMTAWQKVTSGQNIEVTILREGKEVKVAVVAKERPREIGKNYEVIYDHVVSNGHRIRTIITRPQRSGRHPVFMVIQGLGQFSMDYPLTGNGPYVDFIRPFANDGFVTIRVEKPGMGDAEGGPYPETDFVTEQDVYLQALRAIKKYPFVDPDRVFVFGHSMGGLLGPRVVSEEPVAGFIAASTVFKTWNEYWLENVRRQNLLAGATYDQVDQTSRDIALTHAWILQEGKDPAELAKLFPRLKPQIDAEFPEGKTWGGRTIDFWRQLAQGDYTEWWSKVESPTLTLWGQFDFVSTEEDHKMIVDFLNKRKPGLAQYLRVDNADHGFGTVASYEDAYAKLSQPKPFNPEALKAVQTWIKQQIEKD